MSTGALMLGMMTLVLISDMLIALYLRNLADRVESGETVSRNIDPANARKSANLLLWGMLPVWVVVVLIAFGVIPTGIDTIRF